MRLLRSAIVDSFLWLCLTVPCGFHYVLKDFVSRARSVYMSLMELKVKYTRLDKILFMPERRVVLDSDNADVVISVFDAPSVVHPAEYMRNPRECEHIQKAENRMI